MQQGIDKNWLQNRTLQIKKQKEENSKYVPLKNGENKIEIDLTVLPMEQPNGKYGARMIWTTTTKKIVTGKDNKQTPVTLLLSASPTLDSLIVKALSEGYNPFTIIKVGEGKETRYAIKELED